MSKKKDIVRRAAPMPRIREQSTLMQTHESFTDLINGRYPSRPFLDVLGFNYLRSYGARLQDDFYYSDDDDDDSDDDDDDEDYYFYPSRAAYSALDPHPRIRQLTDEEADRHAKELIAEEERRKGKTERNKRKKMRKKERKRLEKENAIKENLPEKDQEKTESSENQEENPIIVSNVDELSKTQNVPQAVGGDESGSISKEETVVKPNKKDVEPKETGINNSYDSTPKLVPEETFNQKSAKERKKEESQLVAIQQPKEEKPKTTGNVDVEKKNETKNEEKPLDPSNEECAKRSRELAAAGNRFAASGQYEIAVKCFTDAIKFNPKEFKLFGNRSLCYERMQQYENALRDADLTLCMEPGWTKGLFRKGKALCGLKKYYEASLVYTEVLKLDSSSAEAKQELKRAQMLHLMEMGFSREESLEALKTHATLEHAVEALFSNSTPAAASSAHTEQPVEQEEDDIEGEWTVQQPSRSRAQQVKESEALSQSRSKPQSPTPPPPPPPLSRSSVKVDLISIWVGSLAPTVTYATLHELFSRVGVVYSIKMLLEHQCAFVNYTRKEDCDRAIQSFNGMVFEGCPLSVRYPSKTHTALSYKKECFFWRTTGCTRQDCTYKHVPEHKHIDRDKFTSRLGRFSV